MDITDADAVHQAAQQVGSMIGDRNLIGLVNNAGIVVSGPLLYLKPREYRRQLEVNMISPLVVIQAFAPLLGTDKKRQGHAGRVVNISSTTAKVVIPLLGAYSSSKSGLEGMSDALRRELMLFGIDVVMIEPGTVNTGMYDKGEQEEESAKSFIYRRSGNGSWQQVHDGLPSPEGLRIPVVTASRLESGVFYCWAGSRIFRSADSGLKWRELAAQWETPISDDPAMNVAIEEEA